MIFHRKKGKCLEYDRENKRPVIHSGICTGEKTAGFKDMHTGRFEDVMLIRGDRDVKRFCDTYGITPDDLGEDY